MIAPPGEEIVIPGPAGRLVGVFKRAPGGAWVGLRAGADDPRVRRLIGVAPLVDLFDFGYLRGLETPVLLVQGDRDQLSSPDRVRALAAQIPGPTTLEILRDGDHALGGQPDAMMAAIARFIVGSTP